MLSVPAGEEVVVRTRLYNKDEQPPQAFNAINFDEVFTCRLDEADDFYGKVGRFCVFSYVIKIGLCVHF